MFCFFGCGLCTDGYVGNVSGLGEVGWCVVDLDLGMKKYSKVSGLDVLLGRAAFLLVD